MDLPSTRLQNNPNYHCGGWNKQVAVLEGTEHGISTHISTMLSIYKIPQVGVLGQGKSSSDSHNCEVEFRNGPLSLKK